MVSIKWSSKLICLLSVALLVIFLPDSAVQAGTTGKISGKVIDKATNEGLPGANITIVGSTMGASSGADGSFFILNVPPGKYSVRATMMGYGPVVQENVTVNIDRTTNSDFALSTAVLEMGKEVVITATRPLVEKDVTSSQSFIKTSDIENMPVANIMDAISLEPGVTVSTTEMKIEVRGGGNDEISFQVDGMERKDRLNDKIYTETNSASVAEIQVLTGGFNAEYGNIRSGVFNVVTKEGGREISGSVDYRMGVPHQKHFGPDAYGTDQYDWKLYAGPNAFNPVMDVEGNQLFIGWDAIAETQNAAGFRGKNDWTPQQLQEVWKYRHRPIEYHNSPDHYVDAGVGGPIPVLDKIGLKEAGFFAGYKFTRQWPTLPSVGQYYQADTKELKINFKPAKAIKVVLSGMLGKVNTSTSGNDWQNSQWRMNYGYDVISSAIGRDKYYTAANNLLDVWNKQFGAKWTHMLSPSTFYEIRYNFFSSESETDRFRNRDTTFVKTIGGVGFDETPVGYVDVSHTLVDLPGSYDFFGGGLVFDKSYVKSQKINFDMTSQVNNQHMIKLGLEYGADHVNRNYKKQGAINIASYGDLFFDRTPTHFAGYIQDKIEYGGMIANVGVRVEHFNANGYIYDPGNPYSLLWARGGTAGYASPDDLPKEPDKSYTYVAPRFAVSHPVGEHTKFFFNYGVYYQEPTNADRFGLWSESMPFGDPQGDIRRIGNANLEAPRTSAYEIGFEQSITNDWTVRAYFYSKDNTDQIGNLRVDGLDGTHSIGDFRNYEGVGKGAAGYSTRRNNNYKDIRGIELRVNKLRGRFFTGWLNMNYLIQTSGNYGFIKISQDPLVAYYTYSAVKQQPQSAPSIVANIDFHTPYDWGMLKGGWRISAIQHWAEGTKVIYNPTGLPTREVRTIYYWVNNYATSIRLNKTIPIAQKRAVRIYMDINNLFNYRALNLGSLNSAQRELYLTQYVDGESGFGKKIGEYEDANGANVFTENWTDSNNAVRAPIAPEQDFALWFNPRSILFGIKLEF